MKKRLLSILLAALMTLSLLCGCEKVPEEIYETGRDSETVENTESTDDAAGYTVETAEGAQLETETQTVNVRYPQIAGWSNAEAQEKWNIEFSSWDYDPADETQEGVEYYETGYQVTEQTDELLSLLVTGSVYYTGAAHPYAFAYAYTIDMTTGEEITLAHLSDEELRAVCDAIASGRFNMLSENFGLTNEELVKTLEENMVYEENRTLADVLYDTLGDTESTSGHNYFIKDGHTCIILEVNHAIGDFMLFEITE